MTSAEHRLRERMRDAELVRRLVAVRTGTSEETGSIYVGKNELFGRHHAPLSRYCASVVGDAARGEELAQDVIETAWRLLERYEPARGSFRAWLYGIARFKSDRASRKKREVLVEDGIFEPQAEEQAIWKRLMRQDRERILLDALRGLPQQEQDALYLRYFMERPVQQITEELGLENASGARALLVRSRRRLEKALRERMNERKIRSSYMVTGVPTYG